MPLERAVVGRREPPTIMQPPQESSPETLARWVAGIAAGDSAAFEALFHAFYDRLCEYAESYVRSQHAAEELVDDVFLALWSGRERLRIEGSVASYLYIAVRNRALNRLRRNERELRFVERRELEIRASLEHQRSETEDWVRSEELFALAQQAIDALPERSRETYLLYYQHGMSYAQIAEVMGVSVRTVENQLARSVKRLWRSLHGLLE